VERPAVEEWRATLTDYERRNLNNPIVVWRKWTAATRVRKPKSRMASVSGGEHGRAQEMIGQQQARISELEGPCFDPSTGSGCSAARLPPLRQDLGGLIGRTLIPAPNIEWDHTALQDQSTRAVDRPSSHSPRWLRDRLAGVATMATAIRVAIAKTTATLKHR
jgi:hypothetical protein